MVNIYTTIKNLDVNTILLDNETFFNKNIKPSMINDEWKSAIKQIDNVKFINDEIGVIKISSVITDVNSLSTDCKTVLNLLYLLSDHNKFQWIKAIDVRQCKWSTIELIFEILEKYSSSIAVFMKNDLELCKCNSREYNVNNMILKPVNG